VGREVVTLGDGTGSEADGHTLFQELGASQASASAAGSAAGSAASLASFDPKPLKHPYEAHMAHNKDKWSQNGGWNAALEKSTQAAKQDLARADKYVQIKLAAKKNGEMGCPCEGEKYYELVWGSPESMSATLGAFGSASSPNNAAGSGAGAGTFESVADAKDDGNKVDDPNKRVSKSTVKKMVKKYGKLGPNSSWTKKHDIRKARAKRALKSAQAEAHAAFLTAIPEFKRLKEDDPAFFSNGDCPCPEAWTQQDAANLSAKESKDSEDAYWAGMRKHRANIAYLTGETARIAAQEAAGEPPEKDHSW